KAYAADLLHWRIIQTLQVDGVRSYDLAGAGSERFPGPSGPTQFKTKFAKEITEGAPAWDMPLKPRAYAALVRALAATRRLTAQVREPPGRLSRCAWSRRRGGAPAPRAPPGPGRPSPGGRCRRAAAAR